jgi:hypothetical protein
MWMEELEHNIWQIYKEPDTNQIEIERELEKVERLSNFSSKICLPSQRKMRKERSINMSFNFNENKLDN